MPPSASIFISGKVDVAPTSGSVPFFIIYINNMDVGDKVINIILFNFYKSVISIYILMEKVQKGHFCIDVGQLGGYWRADQQAASSNWKWNTNCVLAAIQGFVLH